MRRPRGFMITDRDLTMFAVLWLLMVGIPLAAVAAIAVLSILKIWCAFSWYWLLVPASVLAVWGAVAMYARG